MNEKVHIMSSKSLIEKVSSGSGSKIRILSPLLRTAEGNYTLHMREGSRRTVCTLSKSQYADLINYFQYNQNHKEEA